MGINPELLRCAKYYVEKQAEAEKRAFLDGPSIAGGGGGEGGGAPPAGGDPAAAGGAPPADPAAAAGAGFDPAMLQPMIQQAVQQQMAASGGAPGGAPGAAGAGGPAGIKPKIDVNIEIMQLKKMLAKVVDHLGIPIPAQEMTATTQDLTQMAQDQSAPPGGAQPSSAIAPIEPMQGASPAMAGAAPKTAEYLSPFAMLGHRSAALGHLFKAQERRQHAN